MPRLFAFADRKTKLASHQSCSDGKVPPTERAPSMRFVDSILMTSAPSVASMCVAIGPAHQVVASTTRRPARGSAGSPCGAGSSVAARLDAAVVLAEGGSWALGRRALAVDAVRGQRTHEAARGVGPERAAGHHLLVLQHRGAVLDRSHRDAHQLGQLHDLGGRVLAGVGVDDRLPLLESHQTLAGQVELVRLLELGAPDQHEEVVELLGRVGGDADVAVPRRLDRRCLEVRHGADCGRTSEDPPHEVDVGVGHQAGGGLQRAVDVLAMSGAAGASHGRQRRDRREAGAGPLRERAARLEGLLPGTAARADRPALGLDGEVGGGASGQRTGAAEGRDGEDDQPRVAAAQRFAVEGVGRQVLDQQVGAVEELGRRLVLQAAAHAALARVQVAEERAVAPSQVGTGGRPAPQRVAVPRLELHDVGARVDEELRAVRAGDAARVVDDAEVGEAAH